MTDEPYTADNEAVIQVELPMERGVYITFYADTNEHGCFVSGEGFEDGSIGVAGVTEPYRNSDDQWICAAVIHPMDTHIAGEHSIILHDGSHFATFEVTITAYYLNSLDDFYYSGISSYVYDDNSVYVQGYAGSLLYMDIPRNYFGVVTSSFVSSDGTCDIIGEGIDEPFLEKVAIIGPYNDAEAAADEYACTLLVYATDYGWTDDEFSVTIVDGNEENDLEVTVTIVSEYDMWGDYEEGDEFAEDGFDTSVTFADEDEARATEEWT